MSLFGERQNSPNTVPEPMEDVPKTPPPVCGANRDQAPRTPHPSRVINLEGTRFNTAPIAPGGLFGPAIERAREMPPQVDQTANDMELDAEQASTTAVRSMESQWAMPEPTPAREKVATPAVTGRVSRRSTTAKLASSSQLGRESSSTLLPALKATSEAHLAQVLNAISAQSARLEAVFEHVNNRVNTLEEMLSRVGAVVAANEKRWMYHFGEPDVVVPFGKAVEKTMIRIGKEVVDINKTVNGLATQVEVAKEQRDGTTGGNQHSERHRATPGSTMGSPERTASDQVPTPQGRPPPGNTQPVPQTQSDTQRTRHPPPHNHSYAGVLAHPAPTVEQWTEVRPRKRSPTANTIERNQVPAANPTPEKRRIIFTRNQGLPPSGASGIDILSAVNRALFAAKVQHFIRLQEVKRNPRGAITGFTSATCTADMLMLHRDVILKAARTLDEGIIDLELNESWCRLKVHAIPLLRYVGKGTLGTQKLRAEIEAENEGVVIPTQIRWLGSMSSIKDRWTRGDINASSVTFAVKGSDVANRLRKNGVKICGRMHEVEAYVEIAPDSLCTGCSGWGHIESNCPLPLNTRCAICAGSHKTSEHACPVVGCLRGKAQRCQHQTVKCANCKGPHTATSAECRKKNEAINKAKEERTARQRSSTGSSEECPATPDMGMQDENLIPPEPEHMILTDPGMEAGEGSANDEESSSSRIAKPFTEERSMGNTPEELQPTELGLGESHHAPK
jgi:hypothetical protein